MQSIYHLRRWILTRRTSSYCHKSSDKDNDAYKSLLKRETERVQIHLAELFLPQLVEIHLRNAVYPQMNFFICSKYLSMYLWKKIICLFLFICCGPDEGSHSSNKNIWSYPTLTILPVLRYIASSLHCYAVDPGYIYLDQGDSIQCCFERLNFLNNWALVTSYFSSAVSTHICECCFTAI